MADGSSAEERLTTGEGNQNPGSWSPDGQVLAFVDLSSTTGADIWVLSLNDHEQQPFLQTSFNETQPSFSPDGKWLAYASDESARHEIYVRRFPGPGGKWQISTGGGTDPVWNFNARWELLYRSDDKVMAVAITTQPRFSAGKARLLFGGPYMSSPGGAFRSYSVSRDGQHFLMLKESELAEAAPTHINVVLNWFEELKRRVPPGK